MFGIYVSMLAFWGAYTKLLEKKGLMTHVKLAIQN